MKKILLAISQAFLSTCVLLLLLEGAFYVLGFPQGTSDFIERAILQQKLELRKPAGQYRIFVYGESTVHGAGYAPTSSPVKWLDAYLRDFLPGRDIKVINFGRMGEGSDFIAQAFSDTLQYKPDLAIFYLGHNTFFPSSRVDSVKKNEARFSYRLKRLFGKSRLISAVIRQNIKFKIQRHAKETQDVMGDPRIEVTSFPFGKENTNVTLPGGPLCQENIRYFKENIERIIKTGETNRVPVIFMKPVCNLKNYPPNFSYHLKALSSDELTQWDAFYRRGQEAAQRKDDLQAIEFFEKALAIDPTYADLSFRLGQLYFQKGEIAKAKLFFEQARDTDGVIRRAPRSILDVYDDLVRVKQIHYFDTEKAFLPKIPGGILGWPLIEDNVHFSVEGQALAGRALADEIAQNNWIAPRSEWRFDRERAQAEISKELGITDETIFRNYCSVISYLGHRYDERLEFGQRAQAIFPDHPIALRQLAWGYWLTGKKDKALEVYNRLGEKNPSALDIVFLAQPEVKQAYKAFASSRSGLENSPKAGS